MIGKRPQTKPCQAINGIVAEGEERSRVRRERHDRYRSGCGGAQAVEHYEMARYGALMHGPVTQHAESRGLAERKSARGDEGGKVPDPSRGEQGYRRHQDGRVAGG